MEREEVRSALKAVRRLRLASMRPQDAPSPVRQWIATVGLGGTCEYFTSWIGAAVPDGRSAEVMNRFFGLGRLPEEQEKIGVTMRQRTKGVGSILTATRGISPRQVQHLICDGVEALAEVPMLIPSVAADPPPPWTDPFVSLRGRPNLAQRRTLFWAWAQISDGGHTAADAVLFYEYEHGLRARAPAPRSRTERRRWRQLAWSLLGVAWFRFVLATGPSMAHAEELIEQAIGPRLMAVADYPTPAGRPDGRETLSLLMMLPPGAVPPDLLAESVETARYVVRERRPEAPELVGLLRYCLARLRAAKGSDAVPAEISSKVVALSSILSKEQRDVAGIAVAETAVLRAQSVLDGPSVTSAASRAVVVSDTLRTAQELAEMFDTFDMPVQAWTVLRRFREVLSGCGDPEHDVEPDGWLHVLLLTTAGTERHLARVSHHPERWLRSAASHAGRAADLVLGSGRLPIIWGLAALDQHLNVTLDQSERAVTPAAKARLMASADRQLADLGVIWESVSTAASTAQRVARFDFHLSSWRAAAVAGDGRAMLDARAASLGAVGPWFLARDLDRVRRLERHGIDLGLSPPDPGDPWPAVRDRLWVRPPR